jgi:formylglycine-generating enzyme required for sulfatase activity
MGKTEVTWEQYDVYWRNNTTDRNKQMEDRPPDAITTPTPPYGDETRGFGRDGKPALMMTHHAAMEFCYWLSVKTGKKYRLPTEAEWEWACRAGTTTAYSFGDDPAKLGDYAWYVENNNDEVHKVGEKKPNRWGLHDIHGNVAEWCVDHYVKDIYKSSPLDKLTPWPVQMPDDKRYSYVARGGGWSDDAAVCRSAARMGSNKDWLKRDPQRPQSIWWMTDAENVGFRIVRMVDEDYLKDLRSKVTFKSPDD